MKDLIIYDKPMCCNSGVCGPSVDPELVRFADDLRWLEAQGARVTRHNPAQDPHAFIVDPVIRKAMEGAGEEVLPVVVVAGQERSRQRYPAREELARWTGLETPSTPEDAQDDAPPCCGTGCC